LPFRHRRILYTGPVLAGVSTSLSYIAHTKGIALEQFTSRPGLETTTRDGARLSAYADVRSSYFFEGSIDGITKCARPDADAHMRSLKPLFEAHIEYLRVIDGVVFVVDSQLERREANLERLERLVADLGAVGRRDVELPLVFQLNKRDCPSASSVSLLQNELRWPRCEYAPSIARTGEGVASALRTLLEMSLPENPPYR
jgi:hypothetical protein